MEVITSNTILYCKHWQQTVAFYEDILGFKRHFSNEWFVEFWINVNARLSVANEAKASIKSAGGQGITLTLQISDLRAVHNVLQEAAIQPTPIKERWGSEVFYVHDPEGNRIEFWA